MFSSFVNFFWNNDYHKKESINKIQIWWKTIKDNEKKENAAKTIQNWWKLEQWYKNQMIETRKIISEKYSMHYIRKVNNLYFN